MKQFLKDVFSESGAGSASRLMMALHAIAGIGFVAHHLAHGHPLADVPWPGVTGFVIAPYALNQGKSMIAAFAGK